MLRWSIAAVILALPFSALAQDAQAELPTAADEAVPASEPVDPPPPASTGNQPQMPEISSVGGPSIDAQHPEPGQPFYEAWWFWTGIGAILIGIGIGIAVDLTTDDPASRDIGATMMTLRL